MFMVNIWISPSKILTFVSIKILFVGSFFCSEKMKFINFLYILKHNFFYQTNIFFIKSFQYKEYDAVYRGSDRYCDKKR